MHLFRLVTLLIYKVLKLLQLNVVAHNRLVTLLIYKVLKRDKFDVNMNLRLVTLLIYKVLKPQILVITEPGILAYV